MEVNTEMNVYLAYGELGCYSDYHLWPVGVAATLDAAKAACEANLALLCLPRYEGDPDVKTGSLGEWEELPANIGQQDELRQRTRDGHTWDSMLPYELEDHLPPPRRYWSRARVVDGDGDVLYDYAPLEYTIAVLPLLGDEESVNG